MTALQKYNAAHEEIKEKLSTVVFPQNLETSICWDIGKSLDVTGPTIKNYIAGQIKDGYLAEAIYNECKRLKYLSKPIKELIN